MIKTFETMIPTELTSLTEKLQRDMDALAPLDARNSLLLERKDTAGTSMFAVSNSFNEKDHKRSMSGDRYAAAEEGRYSNETSSSLPPYRSLTHANSNEDRDRLVTGAAPYAHREPTIPNLGPYRGYNGAGFCKPTGHYDHYGNAIGHRGY